MRRVLAFLVAVAFVVPMTARLLTAASGAGSFPQLIPPTDASWTRGGSNPILSPAIAWEETAVYEPNIVFDNGWKMYYGGGWSNPAIGLATCPAGADPTNPANWTKYSGNPVLGQGGSGVSGPILRNDVILVAGTYHAFVADANPTGNIKHYTSTDGKAFTLLGTAIANNAASWATGFQNSSVVVDGSTWRMLVDGYNGSTFELAYFTSSDGVTWSIQNSGNQLTTLKVHAGGTYGSPDLHKFGSTWHLYYLAVNGTGNLPTNIYHATSSDLVTWTITPGTPVLTLLGSGYEIDQVSDPNVSVAGSVAYLFYAGMDNTNSAGKIGIATGTAAP